MTYRGPMTRENRNLLHLALATSPEAGPAIDRLYAKSNHLQVSAAEEAEKPPFIVPLLGFRRARGIASLAAPLDDAGQKRPRRRFQSLSGSHLRRLQRRLLVVRLDFENLRVERSGLGEKTFTGQVAGDARVLHDGFIDLTGADEAEIGPEDLPFGSSAAVEEADAAGALLRSAPEQRLTLRELEERYIEQVLRQTGGNKVQAAKILGIDRKTLYRRAERSERELASANAG